MKPLSVRRLTFAALIAAVYAALTMALGFISYGPIQFRIAEALCILPFFLPFTTWGLFVGCILANLLTGCAPWDVVFGSLATLIVAVGTRLLKKNPYIACIPPVVSNAVIVPFVLQKVYGVEDAWWYLALTVGAGEIIACGILGILLYHSIKKIPSLKSLL